jgi:hypothetical protein
MLGLRRVLRVEEAATRFVLRSSVRLLGEATAPQQARKRLAALADQDAAGRPGVRP